MNPFNPDDPTYRPPPQVPSPQTIPTPTPTLTPMSIPPAPFPQPPFPQPPFPQPPSSPRIPAPPGYPSFDSTLHAYPPQDHLFDHHPAHPAAHMQPPPNPQIPRPAMPRPAMPHLANQNGPLGIMPPAFPNPPNPPYSVAAGAPRPITSSPYIPPHQSLHPQHPQQPYGPQPSYPYQAQQHPKPPQSTLPFALPTTNPPIHPHSPQKQMSLQLPHPHQLSQFPHHHIPSGPTYAANPGLMHNPPPHSALLSPLHNPSYSQPLPSPQYPLQHPAQQQPLQHQPQPQPQYQPLPNRPPFPYMQLPSSSSAPLTSPSLLQPHSSTPNHIPLPHTTNPQSQWLTNPTPTPQSVQSHICPPAQSHVQPHVQPHSSDPSWAHSQNPPNYPPHPSTSASDIYNPLAELGSMSLNPAHNILTSFSAQNGNINLPPNLSPSPFQLPSSHTTPPHNSLSQIPQSTTPPPYPQNHSPHYPTSSSIPSHSIPSHSIPSHSIPSHQPPFQTPSPVPPTNSAYHHVSKILSAEVLLQQAHRPKQAHKELGQCAIECREGLSRLIDVDNPADLDLFLTELENNAPVALEPHCQTMEWDKFPIFAISYVIHQVPGPFRLTLEQKDNLKTAVAAIKECGVTVLRFWLDQCVTIRGRPITSSWAHTKIVPFVIWPVISLGTRRSHGDRTCDTYRYMWPFVEEVAALWGMGSITASQYDPNEPAARIRWLSCSHRRRLDPHKALAVVLFNIFHGAIDDLRTASPQDKIELREMARWNVLKNVNRVAVGNDWQLKVNTTPSTDAQSVVEYLSSRIDLDPITKKGVYLDTTKKLPCTRWDGIIEWMSGNGDPSKHYADNQSWQQFDRNLEKYTVITNIGRYQLLSKSPELWLLVCMSGLTGEKVDWTKIMTGPSVAGIPRAADEGNMEALQSILREPLCAVTVHSCESFNKQIQWQ